MKKRTATIDGTAYTFGPLLIATLEEHQEPLGRAQRGEMTNPAEFGALVVTLATASMRRVDPAITREWVAEQVDLDNAQAFFAATFGVTVPESAAGEAAAASA